MDIDLFLYNKRKQLTKFKVVGLLPSPHFQKCRFMVQKLHTSFPEEYAKPEIRPMLNLDWDEYLTKMRRRHGKPYYLLHVPVAVYLDGQFIGDDDDLSEHIGEKFRLKPNLDFQQIADGELMKYFIDIVETYKRKFAYLTIAIDEHVVGSMLFMLYNDLVPNTCDNFLARCVSVEDGYSYKGKRMHRIAKYSWIQFGDFTLKHVHMPCQNYAVPHNRRGVLSMCNERRHVNNSFQFFITLEPADWMDCNYVAFGQLIQGAEVLKMLEKVSAYYENPLNKIQIINCGEFSLCPQLDEEYVKALNPPYDQLFNQDIQMDDVDSILNMASYKKGKYFLRTDLKPYMPFSRFSRMFDTYLKEMYKDVEVCEEYSSREKEIDEELESTASIESMKRVLVNSGTFYFVGSHVIL